MTDQSEWITRTYYDWVVLEQEVVSGTPAYFEDQLANVKQVVSADIKLKWRSGR